MITLSELIPEEIFDAENLKCLKSNLLMIYLVSPNLF